MTGSQTPAGPAPTGDPKRVWTCRPFGVTLEADLPVLGFAEAKPGEEPVQSRLKRASAASIDSAWPADAAERLIDRRRRDGRAIMTVDAHPGRGYRIDAPGHGRFRVSPDGSLVECAPSQADSWRWHRPLFAQALPLVAALKGMELLHASAVTIDGAAIAVAGHSGAGKTSLAIHLTDQGASLLADDVVSLSVADGELRAHPGVSFANIAGEQMAALGPDRERFGTPVGSSDKLHVLVARMATAPAPLSALYFLGRRDSAAEVRFERLQPPSPRELFGAAFLSHVAAPARMRAQLEVQALIASAVPTYRLLVPAGLAAHELAPRVAEHSRAVRRSPAPS